MVFPPGLQNHLSCWVPARLPVIPHIPSRSRCSSDFRSSLLCLTSPQPGFPPLHPLSLSLQLPPTPAPSLPPPAGHPLPSPHLPPPACPGQLEISCLPVPMFIDGLCCGCFLLFRAAPVAHGNCQARGGIGAAAPGMCRSHSHARSEPCLRATPQLMATRDPQSTERG